MKKIIISCVAVSFIFISFLLLRPIGELHHLNKNEYSLRVDRDFKVPYILNEKEGRLLVRIDDNKTNIGRFVFKKDLELFMEIGRLSENNNSKINITVLKNDREIISVKERFAGKKKIDLNISKGDSISIVCLNDANNVQDIAEINLKAKYNYKKIKIFIIPFLYSIFFLLLLWKGYRFYAIASFLLYMLILIVEKINFGPLELENILAYMLFMFGVTLFLVLLYQELNYLKKRRFASVINLTIVLTIYTIPMFLLIYIRNFHSKFTNDILYTLFQTNINESYEFINDYIKMKYIILYVLVSFFFILLFYKQEKVETKKIETGLLLFMCIAFAGVALALSNYLRLPKFFFHGYKKYTREVELFKKIKEQRKTGNLQFNAYKNNSGETYVIIIGESLNKKHMGIYNYFRDTTPLLEAMNKKNELIIFNNVYSNHTHTVPVLSLALTEANQYNKKSYFKSLSIIDILKKSNFETYWITNQNLYGVYENLVSVIASRSDFLIPLNSLINENNTPKKYDGALIEQTKNILLKKTTKNRVIFVHLLGNHSTYASRYPKNQYQKYYGDLNQAFFGKKTSKNKILNDYDNSVVYNDFVVSSIMKDFKRYVDIGAVLYIPDHADDVVNELGHNSSLFTFSMTQIPMIACFTEGYKQKYKRRFSSLMKHKNSLFSNDMLYSTMIGIFGIKTDRYSSKFDLSSEKYSLRSEDALVLHGAYRYMDKGNKYYWQKNNQKYLYDTNQSIRVIPHRVNSIGKLSEIWSSGFRAFEIDIRFYDNNKTLYRVGHDKGVMGLTLNDFLESIDYKDIQKIWLDFKNLNKDNYQDALTELENLNNKYDLKRKAIVESSAIGKYFREFRKRGWHTSYYLPTSKLIDLLEKKADKNMEIFSNKLASQIELQQLSAVSFDSRLYPFVKKFLEPKISTSIVYHSWLAPALKDPMFVDKIINNKLYLDPRVKTILTSYESDFEL